MNNKLFCCLAIPLMGMHCFAAISPKDVESFFSDFVTAFNANDVERVRKMSGKTWKRWSENINGGESIEGIEISEIRTDNETNVVAKMTVIQGSRSKSADVIFTLIKTADEYSIEAMIFPEVEMRSREFHLAVNMVESLISRINAHDMDSVEDMFSFTGAKNLDLELSSRGLMWIKSAIDDGVKVSLEDSGVGRERDGTLIGRMFVPCPHGGTNVLQRFIFKDGKIDRAAPRKETKEEFMRRFNAEKEKSRKEWEDREAVEKRFSKRSCSSNGARDFPAQQCWI